MKYITAALAALFPLVLSAQTYTNEVASIINDNCVVCHRAGGIGEGLAGLGEGVAGLGQGLGAGLMGLAAQQAMMPGQIAAATPIQPVDFDPFRQGLTRRKLAQPLRIGMFTGGARNA